MTRKTVTLIILFIIPLGLMGQYVCYDEDGYTNVRKGPGTQYEIIDKVSKYEVFYSSDWLCGEGRCLDDSLTWIPFARSIYDAPDEKFIFRKNIRSLDKMPVVGCRRLDNDANRTFVCANDTVSISLVLRDFDVKNHIIETSDWDGEKRVINVDGEWPKGFFLIPEEELPKQKEISEFYIVKGDKRIDLPIGAIKEYFNPWSMSVYLGYNGELYIWISVGDASEAYGICLSVVDESIKFTLEWSSC